MKRYVLFLLFTACCCIPLYSQTVIIPDTAFLQVLLELGVDTSGNGTISNTEAEAIDSLDISAWKFPELNPVSDLTGMEAFVNLKYLNCANNQLIHLDVSNNDSLTDLICTENQLNSLDLTNNEKLEFLNCGSNQLTNLDVSGCSELFKIVCSVNQLTELDISTNTKLDWLSCSSNYLKDLDLSNNLNIRILGCSSNLLRDLNLSNNNLLESLYCGENQIRYLDISSNFSISRFHFNGMPSLSEVCVWTTPFPAPGVIIVDEGTPGITFSAKCGANVVGIPDTSFLFALFEEGVDTNSDSVISYQEAVAVTNLNINGRQIIDLKGVEVFVNLDTLRCSNNQIATLDLSNNPVLRYLDCSDNQLTDLNFSDNLYLEDLQCSNNPLWRLNLSNNSMLKSIGIRHMPALTDVCGWTVPFPPENVSIDTSGSFNIIYKSDCRGEYVTIPDQAFLFELLEQGVDTNGDSLISFSEAEIVTNLLILSSDISDLTGLNAFINIDTFKCFGTTTESLNLPNHASLKYLVCGFGLLKSINVSNCSLLEEVYCMENKINHLDLSNCTSLKKIDCSYNNLRIIDLTDCVALEEIRCKSNQITYLDISNNTSLVIFEAPVLNQLCVWTLPFPRDYFETELSELTRISIECGSNEIHLPDSVFLAVLYEYGVDKNADSLISYLEAESTLSLNISDRGISDLTGIEAFINLDSLICSNNNLATLDLSDNFQLRAVNCENNQITSLEVNGCADLERLICGENELSELNIFNNSKLTTLGLSIMPSLNKVCVSKIPFPPEIMHIDTTGSPNIFYSADCKSIYVDIRDMAFLYGLIERGVDLNGDEKISYSEAAEVHGLDLSGGYESNYCTISDLYGIEAFINMEYFRCNRCPIDTLDLSYNQAIKYINSNGFYNFNLKCLNVAGCSSLEVLECNFNELSFIDISGCSSIQELQVYRSDLHSIDLSESPKLKKLFCGYNQLSEIDLSNNVEIENLSCEVNQLSDLDISNNITLKNLSIYSMPSLFEVCVWDPDFPSDSIFVSMSSSPNVYFSTECGSNGIFIPDSALLLALIDEGVDSDGNGHISYREAETSFSLDISARGISDLTGIEEFINLETLKCNENILTTLNTSSNSSLSRLECSNNQLTEIEVGNNDSLRYLDCGGNNLMNLDVSANTKLDSLLCGNNEFNSLDISRNPGLSKVGISGLPDLKEVCVWELPFPSEVVSVDTAGSPNIIYNTECGANLVFIPDSAFLYALIHNGVDTNPDSLITYVEAGVVSELNVSNYGISDMTGIEAFINLETLDCYYNNITNLDLTYNSGLKFLQCHDNQLSDITIPGENKLEQFICDRNMLTELDVSDFKNLKVLFCDLNQLLSLDASNCPKLEEIWCARNQLQVLKVGKNDSLKWLSCDRNLLTELNTSSCSALEEIWCDDNLLNHLDISGNQHLKKLGVTEMPSLQQICVWTIPFPPDGMKVYSNNSPNFQYSIECGANSIFIPDTAFLHALIEEGVDINGDSLISYNEAEAKSAIDVSNNEISDMTGIEAFVNLGALDCSGNHMMILNTSKSTDLHYLDCHNNELEGLDISGNVALITLKCGDNLLSNLDVTFNPLLRELICDSNNLSGLNVTTCKFLTNLDCNTNLLDSLDIASNKELADLVCYNNHLVMLDLSENTTLTNLNCQSNQLTMLDITNNYILKVINCDNNLLTALDISTNRSLWRLTIGNMPSLKEVCTWTGPFNVQVEKEGSNDVIIKECIPPQLYLDPGIINAGFIAVSSSEDGMIYSVPEQTEKEMSTIIKVSMDSVVAYADSYVSFPISTMVNGEYWFYAIDLAGNVSDPKVFTIEGVGIDQSVKEPFRIYPNPTQNKVTIQFDNQRVHFIEIYSVNGHIVYQNELIGDLHQIDLSTFRNGIYYISVKSDDFFKTERLVKL